MNDFTKKELQIILIDMNNYILNTKKLNESPIHAELRNKIQSMIDNYCEHRETYTKLWHTVCLNCKELIKIENK